MTALVLSLWASESGHFFSVNTCWAFRNEGDLANFSSKIVRVVITINGVEFVVKSLNLPRVSSVRGREELQRRMERFIGRKNNWLLRLQVRMVLRRWMKEFENTK